MNNEIGMTATEAQWALPVAMFWTEDRGWCALAAVFED